MDSSLDRYLDLHFDIESLVANYEYGYLSTIIEECFLREKRGEIVLSKIFARLNPAFSFIDFFERIGKKNKQKAFLIRLLYTLYAHDFPLQEIPHLQRYLSALLQELYPSKKEKQPAVVLHGADEAVVRELKRLQPFCKNRVPITKKAVRKFLDIFGLYDHQMPVELHHLEANRSLVDKLESLNGPECSEFVERILLHIEALTAHPEWYSEGLKLIAHVLPTRNKELKKLFWLESTAKSIRRMKVEDHPIYVLDQSDEPLFTKNRRYAETISKRYKVPIIYMGANQIVEEAKSVGCEHLVAGFGYGAARNAAFIIAKKHAQFIHMGDDDVKVHPSLIYSDALWAYLHKGQYVAKLGYIVGRYAKDSSFTKHDVRYEPHKILSQCPWISTPYPHGMACLVSAPKLCLNLPFGQEENQMLAIKTELFDFRVPSVHLAGPRYPESKTVPKTRYSGLGAFLQKRYVDVVQRLLMTELIDPSNRYGQCALPWNLRKTPFTSFEEMRAFMQAPETVKKMQAQFWKNFKRLQHDFVVPPTFEHISSSQALEEIITTDWDKEFVDLPDLQAFYKEFAKQAKAYKEYMLNPQIEQPPSKEQPLAYSLYLYCKMIGNAEFCKIIEPSSTRGEKRGREG